LTLRRDRPLLCLITDRRRLRPGGGAAALDAVVRQVAGAAQAGVDLVQVRERDLDARDLGRLVARCLAVTHPAAVVVVNDRVDVALAEGAGGVHLRENSVPPARVRAFAPAGFVIGRSVHDEAGVRAFGGGGDADYLVLGPVSVTASKPPGHPALGFDRFAQAARGSAVPVLAIGGLTIDRFPAALAAGAGGVAAIGLFIGPPDGDVKEAANAAVRRALDAFAGWLPGGKLGPGSS